VKRFLNSLIKFVAYTTAGVVILLAIAVGLFRLFLPRLPEYQEQIKTWASDAIGMQVEFSGMDARWGLRGPELEFYDAELLRKSTSTRVVAAREVSVGVGLMRLIVDRTLIVDRVTVRETAVEVRQLGDGRWWIQGTPADELFQINAGNGGQLGDIEVVGEDIELRFLQPEDERPHFFDVRRVQFRRDEDRMTLDAIARLPDELGRNLDVSAIRLLGIPERQRSWDVSIELEGIKLAPISELLEEGRRGFRSGVGDLEVSLVVADKAVRSATANIDFNDLSVEDDKSFDMEARVEYNRHRDGWLLAAERLVLKTDEGKWPESSLRVEVSTNRDGEIVVLDARASYLNLADAVVFLPWFPAEQQQQLQRYAADGTVHELAVTLSDLHRAEPRFDVSAELENVGMAAVGKLPGVRGFTGSIRAGASGGRVEIDAENLVIESADVFPEPLKIEEADGTIIWRAGDGGLTILSDSIRLQTAVMLSQSNVQITVAGDGSSPVVDLVSTFSISDIAAAKRYIPTNVVKPKLYNWFQGALESGSVPRGSARLYGPLDKFPFDGGEGRLLIQSNVQNASLRYQPLWPAADLIDVDVIIDNARLYTERGRSANVGNQVVDAKIEIPDLRNPVLTIDAFATGTLETVRQFVIQSPLSQVFGGQMERITVDGEASFDLDLMIPIRSAKDFEVTTRIRSNNGFMQVEGFPAPVTDLGGVVTVTRDTIQSESFGGTFLGRPVTIDLYTPADAESQFSAVATTKGVMTAEALVTELGLPLADIISGQSDYQLDIKFPKRAHATPAPLTFAISSDLEGLAIMLPQPLGKIATGTLPIVGDIRILDGGERIDSSGMAGEGITWQWSIAHAENEWDFDRGVLALGGELVEQAETRGLHIRGSVAEVRLQDWLDLSRGGDTQLGVVDRIRSIDLNVANLYLLGQHLVDHRVRVDRSASDWLAQFDGESVKGSAFIPYDFGGERAIVLDMERLHLPGDEEDPVDTAGTTDPRNLPPISLKAADFAIGARHFGSMQTELARTDAGLETDSIIAKDDTFEVVGAGRWVVDEADPSGQRTFLRATLTSNDVRTTMARLDYNPGISSNDMAVLLDVSWSGGPGEDFLSTLDGEVQARFGSGQLNEVEPGAGRMFGLMSIAALPRRLSLDFRDVFDKGFGFDSIGGTFRIDDGEAFTCNLSLVGPAADIGIVGRTSLDEGYYEQTAVVSANVGNTLPIVGAVVGGPPAAAAMFLFSQIFKKPLKEVGQVFYSISGSWDEPAVESSNADRFAQIGELAGCLENSE
jgi:uncharacterized protein (TIGR02099 family)